MIEEYEEVLLNLKDRLILKHKEKGTSYRKMKLAELMVILDAEMKELDNEFWGRSTQGVLEEALDVAICGLIIADWILHNEVNE